MVYIDVYFGLNLFMNVLVLFITGRVRKYPRGCLRKLGAAALGAAGALLPLCLELPFWAESLVLPIAESLLMCLAAYRPGNWKQLAVQALWLWMVTWMLGGILNWMYFHTSLGYGIQLLAAGKPFPVSSYWVLAAAAAAGGCLMAAWWVYRNRKDQKSVVFPVILWHKGRKVEVTALADTGNRLYAPGGAPVSLIGPETAGKILGQEELAAIQILNEYDTSDKSKECTGSKENKLPDKLLLIPYRSVGKSHGLLPAVRIDRAEVCCPLEHRVTEQAVIAVSREKLTESGRYEMILHTGLL